MKYTHFYKMYTSSLQFELIRSATFMNS